MGLSDPARMESEDLPLTHATYRSTGSEDRHGLGWWVLGCLLPSCPLMSSVLSQGPRSQPCSASTASSLTQQGTFPVLLRQLGTGKVRPNSACGFPALGRTQL